MKPHIRLYRNEFMPGYWMCGGLPKGDPNYQYWYVASTPQAAYEGWLASYD